MKEQKIKVLALLPMELPKEIELDNTLEAMQKFVGGPIECITSSLKFQNKFIIHHFFIKLFTAMELHIHPHFVEFLIDLIGASLFVVQ